MKVKAGYIIVKLLYAYLVMSHRLKASEIESSPIMQMSTWKHIVKPRILS